MASHDCFIRGSLALKSGVTEDQVLEALDAVLDYHNIDFDTAVEKDEIQLSADLLHFNLSVYGYGGLQNDANDQLAKDLAAIVTGPAYFEFIDEETGDSDAHTTPYFIGATPAEQTVSRLHYGLEQLDQWIKPLVTDDAYAQAKQILMAGVRPQ